VSMTSGRSVSANSNYRALERQIRNRERRRVLTTGAAINIVGRSSTRDVYPLALHQVAGRVPGLLLGSIDVCTTVGVENCCIDTLSAHMSTVVVLLFVVTKQSMRLPNLSFHRPRCSDEERCVNLELCWTSRRGCRRG
jgi:hypothetical protein